MAVLTHRPAEEGAEPQAVDVVVGHRDRAPRAIGDQPILEWEQDREGASRHVLEMGFAALGREHGPGRLQHALAIAARVGPEGAGELFCVKGHVHNCRR